jgi:ankyrin repeat protein
MNNKYNVLAKRRELDNTIRNGAWNKFRCRLEDLSAAPELLQAVVLTNKSKLGNGGTLLHAILKHNNLSVNASAKFISQSVPQSLHVQDSRLATPLHLAIESYQSTTLVESFLEKLRELEQKNELHKLSKVLVTTDKSGDNPLLKAARQNATHLIPLLVRYDETGSSTLVENKKKNRVALWYCVSNELQYVCKSKQYFPPREVKIILLSTFFALQRSWGLPVAQEDCMLLEQLLKESPTSCIQHPPTTESINRLVLRALVGCSHLLGKLSIKLMDLLSENENFPSLSKAIDPEQNCLLHHLCLKDTRMLPDRTAANVTNLLLLVKRDNCDYDSAIRHRNRSLNLPLHVAVGNHNFDFARDLLKAYPGALECANELGELPVHILLKLKPPFVDDISTFATILMDFRTKSPATLTVQDGETGLYPFQLAGCCEWGPYLRSDNGGMDEAAPANSTMVQEAILETDVRWVDMIYDLMQAAPQVVLD